ncbi:hypothetical protein G4B88_007182 [Cannabis sativa]|uniref:DUF7086 domain-containing protein n=1 Tax=Cannabis sativa TaxID=3483 RepID=A0A7J6E6A1_CANSA|nr:hypothetical protein G4B88_007182 [Cannabis sativa]
MSPNAIEKIKVAKNKSSQGRLESFFKPAEEDHMKMLMDLNEIGDMNFEKNDKKEDEDDDMIVRTAQIHEPHPTPTRPTLTHHLFPYYQHPSSEVNNEYNHYGPMLTQQQRQTWINQFISHSIPPYDQYYPQQLINNPPLVHPIANHYHPQKPRIQRRTTNSSSEPTASENNNDEDNDGIAAAPYPWAKKKPGFIHSMEYLVNNKIVMIGGMVNCDKCKKSFKMELELMSHYNRLKSYIAQEKGVMNDRAPEIWLNPIRPNCIYCHSDKTTPVVASKDEEINWLFLLLGQWLGICTLTHLKFFCMCTKNHRTGAKDRICANNSPLYRFLILAYVNFVMYGEEEVGDQLAVLASWTLAWLGCLTLNQLLDLIDTLAI